jgi:hypothetical protein
LKRAIQLIVSLSITLTCFWWTFKDTLPFSHDPAVTARWDAMVESMKSVNLGRLGIYLVSLLFIHIARTKRWGHWLSGIEKVPFRLLNEASGIGFMMLIVLPFRLGEFARPYLIAERSKIRRSAAMTSVVFERIIDGLIIAVLLRVLLFFVKTDSPGIAYVQFGSTMMFLVFGGGLLFLLFGRWQHERAVKLISATFGRVSPKLGEKVGTIVDGFVGATKQLPNAPNMIAFFAWTAVYWVLNGWGTAYLASAFDCHGAVKACEPLMLTSFDGYVILSVLIVGMMIPAAPGSAGTFQAFIKLGLSLFVPAAVVNTSGVAYANVLWVTQIIQQISFGLILMVVSHRSFRDLAGKMSEEAEAAKTTA